MELLLSLHILAEEAYNSFMYECVLSAVNERLNSEIAARYAMRFALSAGARLCLAYTVEKDTPREAVIKAEESMGRILLEAKRLDIEVKSISVIGEIDKLMTSIVKDEGVDIVFASTRRAGVGRKIFQGSASKRLMDSTPCAFALVGVVHAGRIHPGNILVPLKARMNSIDERAYFTARVATAFNSKIVLFHSPKPFKRFFSGEVQLSHHELKEKSPKDIKEFLRQLQHYGVKPADRHVPGRSSKTIAEEAFAGSHDLIIMGASERGFFKSIMRGNPIEELLVKTPCNIIIHRPSRKR